MAKRQKRGTAAKKLVLRKMRRASAKAKSSRFRARLHIESDDYSRAPYEVTIWDGSTRIGLESFNDYNKAMRWAAAQLRAKGGGWITGYNMTSEWVDASERSAAKIDSDWFVSIFYPHPGRKTYWVKLMKRHAHEATYEKQVKKFSEAMIVARMALTAKGGGMIQFFGTKGYKPTVYVGASGKVYARDPRRQRRAR